MPLPKLTPNLERVIIWKLRSDPNDYDIISIVKYNLLLFEILIRNDYAVGDRFVADFTGHTASTIARNNPLIISKFLSLYQVFQISGFFFYFMKKNSRVLIRAVLLVAILLTRHHLLIFYFLY